MSSGMFRPTTQTNLPALARSVELRGPDAGIYPKLLQTEKLDRLAGLAGLAKRLHRALQATPRSEPRPTTQEFRLGWWGSVAGQCVRHRGLAVVHIAITIRSLVYIHGSAARRSIAFTHHRASLVPFVELVSVEAKMAWQRVGMAPSLQWPG
jgi:hypothetical protein